MASLHPISCEFIHTVATIPIVQNSDRCTFHYLVLLAAIGYDFPGVNRIRILYMPPVYAIISFLSFRFFRSYTYYSLAETGELAPSFSSALRVSIFSASVRGAWCRVIFEDVGHSRLRYTRLLP
jgi:hypothetical protein